MYATLKDNNRADTVLELFMKGVQEFGLPSRVRSDHGLKNVGGGTVHARESRTGQGKYDNGKLCTQLPR